MLRRTSIRLLLGLAVVGLSSIFCDIDGRETQRELEQQGMTQIALEATRISTNMTETAQATITPPTPTEPPPTPTEPPPTATNTPEPAFILPSSEDLPTALFSGMDPAGDAALCNTGESVDDPAVDIVGLMIYGPQDLGMAPDSWLARVELGVPANQTFTMDWSAAVLLAAAAAGEETYTFYINEIHAGETTKGMLDENGQNLVPDTEDLTWIDDEGFIWFNISREAAFVQVSSFHTPSEDLPADQKRCDVAPDESVYTLNLPE